MDRIWTEHGQNNRAEHGRNIGEKAGGSEAMWKPHRTLMDDERQIAEHGNHAEH